MDPKEVPKRGQKRVITVSAGVNMDQYGVIMAKEGGQYGPFWDHKWVNMEGPIWRVHIQEHGE